jgi:hypothetical protein
VELFNCLFRSLRCIKRRMENLRIAASHRCDDRVLSGIAFPHVEHFIELITLNCLLDIVAAMVG